MGFSEDAKRGVIKKKGVRFLLDPRELAEATQFTTKVDLPFKAENVLRARNTRMVLIPVKFAILGATVIYLKEEKPHHFKKRNVAASFKGINKLLVSRFKFLNTKKVQTVEIYFLLQIPNLPQYYYYEIQPIPGISKVGVCMKNKPARQNLENHLRRVYSREKVSERKMFHQLPITS